MPAGAGFALLRERRSPSAVATEIAAATWPILAALLAGLALFAVAGDHVRTAQADPAILPEGWTPASFRTVLAAIGLSPAVYAVAVDFAKTLFLGAFFGAGILAWRCRAADRGALLVAYFLVIFGASWEVEPARLPALLQPALAILDLLSWAAFINFFFLFPDGRYRPRWLRWAGLAIPAGGLVAMVAQVPQGVSFVAFIAMLAIAVAAQVLRFQRHSSPAQRQQARWLVLGFAASASLTILTVLLGLAWRPPVPSPAAFGELALGQAVGQLAFIPIPLAIATAITRHRLWDLDRVLSRTLLYGALSAGILAVYGGLALGLGSRLGAGGGPLVALLSVAIVAVLLQPARHRLQGLLNRAFYGARDDPDTALAALGRRLRDNLAPDAALEVIAATVRDSLRVPYVEVRVHGQPERVVTAGTASHRPSHSLPVQHQGQTVGEIRVAFREGEDRFSERDLRLLEDLAPNAGPSIREAELSRQLQSSRAALVLAREEERRRLSRVLHDDLGATLAAQKLRAGGMAAGQAGDARQAAAALEEELGRAIHRLRELSYELRPPTLDDAGLHGALTDLIERNRRPGFEVALDLPDPLPRLVPAAELCIYRVVEQALANVLRHSRATHCAVRLEIDSEARLEIEDDGVGIPPQGRPGVGLRSIRERAEELGGSSAVGPAEGRGTLVSVRFQLPPVAGD